MPQERAMTREEAYQDLVRQGLIVPPQREGSGAGEDERRAAYEALVRDGLIVRGTPQTNEAQSNAPLPEWSVGRAFRAGISDVLTRRADTTAMEREAMADRQERGLVNPGILGYLFGERPQAAPAQPDNNAPAGLIDKLLPGLRENQAKDREMFKAYREQRFADAQESAFRREDTLRKMAGAVDPGEYAAPESAVGQFAHDFIRNSPYTLASMAASVPVAVMTGGAAVPMALTSAALGHMEAQDEMSDVYKHFREQGLTPDEAYRRAMPDYAANVGVLAASNYLQTAVTAGAGKAVREALDAAAAGTAPSTALGKAADAIMKTETGRKLLTSRGGPAAASILFDAISEGVFEEAPQNIASSLTKGEPIDWEQTAYEAALGAASGALFGAGGSAMSYLSDRGEGRRTGAELPQNAMQPQLAQPQAPDAAQAQRLAQAQVTQPDATGPQSAQNQPSSAQSGAPDTLIDEIISEVNAAQETAAQTGSSQEATARGNAEVVADAVNSAPLEGLEKARTREPIQAAAQPQPQESVTLKQDGQAAQPVAPQPQPGNFVRFRSNGQLMQTPVDYALMEIDDLVTSNLDSGGVNPAYPAEFQPRDRSRASGMLQVSQMARDLRPELLGADEYADRGAPIIDARGNVISGNGRTMSIRSAYRNQPDTSGARYRNWLSENAAALGLDGNAARSMRNPVLVRRLTDPQLDLRAFAEDANTPVVAGMSASEQAMKDAERLTPEILAKFVPNDTGDVLTNNGEFVQAFGDGVVDRSEMERFINREGRLSQDGARRIKNALVAKAYGDSGFLERVSESTDDDMRNLSNALTQAAPAIASAEEKMSRGLLDSNLSLRAPLIEAVRELECVREQGGNVAEVLNQQGLFGEQLSDEAKILLQFFDANKRSAKAIRTLLTDYAATVEEKGDPRQASMFDAEGETASQLLARMAARQGKGADGRAIQAAGDQGRLDFNAPEEPTAQVQRDEAVPVTATPAPSAPQTAAAYPIENARKAYTTAGETRENIEYSADEESDGSFSVSKITSTRDENGVIVATRRDIIEAGLDEREAEKLRMRLQSEESAATRNRSGEDEAKRTDSLIFAEGYHSESGRPLEESDRFEFVIRPDGSNSFGAFGKDVEAATGGRVKAVPIRLQVGYTRPDAQGNETGFGLAHIKKREAELQKIGYNSAEDYITDIIGTYDKIYGHKKSNRIQIVRSGTKSGVMPLELILDYGDEGFYTVVSVFPYSEKKIKQKIKEPLLYDRRGTTLSTISPDADAAKKGTNGDKVRPVVPAAAEEQGSFIGSNISQSAATGKSAAKKRKDKIDDFGEKIGGARKDTAVSYREKIARAFSEEDIATKPLSEVFPAPDYNALIASGMDKKTVAIVRAVRESVPNKPRGMYKMNGYIKTVKMLRDFTNEMLSDPEAAKRAAARMSEISVPQKRAIDKARLYELLGHDVSLKDYVVQSGEYTVYNGERFAKPTEIWSIRKSTSLTDLGVGRTFEEAAEVFRKYLASGKGGASAKKTEFSIYRYPRGSEKEGFYVGKKVGREYIDLAGPFDNSPEAMAYINEHNEELMKQLDNFKTVPSERRDENAPRVGVDMRVGEDVTPERFASTFGFYGVEFGNWVEQGRRQVDLNDAYDALMDLAAIIGVPPKALSLNGRLGLAFGARGKGGRGSVRINAHYERGYMAINLTKERGAGSLAHEWMHALDDYLGDMLGKTEMASETGEVMLTAAELEEHVKDLGGMRPEMLRALGKVYSAVRTETGLEKRSKNLDGRRTGGAYWAKVSEMEARAFEAYIADKLAENGASNDYLVNIVSEEYWRAQNEQLGHGELHDYPYPTVSEMPAIRAAFDALFRTVKTRETERGMEMYRIAENAEQRDAALRNAMLYGKPVARLTGEEFAKRPGESLAERVAEYFQREYGGAVERKGFGRILLNKRSVRNDILHGVGRMKAISFAAVPDVLTKGKVLRYVPNWKGRGYGTYAIGAPIEIANDRYLAIAIVNEAEDANAGSTHGEFYLHEVMLQDIPPDASEVPSQQAYRDAGVVHAATKAGEAAHVHRSSDGPIAASAEAVQLPRGDSSSNGNVSRGDIYTLLHKVMNVNGMPEVSAEALRKAYPFFRIKELSRGRLLISAPGGLQMYLTNSDTPIEIRPESFREEYGRDVTPDDIATGRTTILNKKAFIDLVNGVSTMEDANEEFYHIAENMLLTKKERGILEKAYGGEKARADAYRDFVRGRMGQLNARSVPLFRRIKDIFARIRRMIFGPRSEDIFRDIAEGRAWNHEAIASNGTMERYRADEEPHYEVVFEDGNFRAEISSNNRKVVEELGLLLNASRREDISGNVGAQHRADSSENEGAASEVNTEQPEDAATEGNPTDVPVVKAAQEFAVEADEAQKEATSSIPAEVGKIINDVLTIEGDGAQMEKYAAQRSKKRSDLSLWESIAEAWKNHVDDLHPIERYFGEDLYRLAGNALWGARGPAEDRLFNGDPARGVKGLVPTIKSVKPEHRRGFSYYGILKHLADVARFSYEAKAKEAELQAKLKAGGLSKKERKTIRKELNRLQRMEKVTMASPAVYDKAVAAIEQKFPEWIEPQKELVKYNQALLDMLADSGIISAELRDELKRRYPNYVPLQRDFHQEDGLERFVNARGMVNVNSPLKRLRGSKRDVIDPMDQIVQNTFAFQMVVARQSVAQEIVKRYDNGEFRDLITEVYGKEQYKRLAYEAFEKAKEAESPEKAAELNKQGQHYMSLSDKAKELKYSPEDGVFFVFQDGKKRLFKTDKDIFNALVMSQGGKHSKDDNYMMKLMAAPANALRYGTTHSLTFGFGNMVRDTYSYAIVGKHFRPFVDTALGALTMLTNKELVQDFIKNGGLQGSAWQAAREYTDMMRELRGVRRETGNELLDKIANSGVFNNPAVNAVFKYNPISLYLKLSGAFAEFSEQASRIGQYQRLLDKGYSKEDAIFETRDNMNFMRGSASSRQISRFVPFYNTALQGLDKLMRTIRHDGKWDAKALARAALWITGTSLLTTAINYMGDDEDKEKYLNLKPWRKNMFWNIVIGGEVFSLPKPFEAGMIFGSLPERFMDYLWQNDKRAFDGLASSIAASLTPDLVALFPSVMFELSSGYSQFYGRMIVPMSEARLDPELQYGPHTAEWAKQVANIMKYAPDFSGVPYIGNLSNILRSPRMLEYAVLAMTGSAGRDLSGVYNHAYRAVKGEPRPTESPLLWIPGVRRFFADAKYGGRDQDAFRSEIGKIMVKLNSAENLYEQRRFGELDVRRIRLLQIRGFIKDTNKFLTSRNRGINAANRTIQRITTAPNMTAKQKREAIDQINAYVLAMSREGLMRVEEIKKYLRTDKM